MNYIKLFEEFDPKYIIPLMEKIGKKLPKFGHAKMCFEFGKNCIIKFFQLDKDIETEIVNCIEQKKLNLSILPKIYKIGMIKPKGNDYFKNLFGKYLSNGRMVFDENKKVFFIIEEKFFIDKNNIEDLIDLTIKYIYHEGFSLKNHLIKHIQYDVYKKPYLRERLESFRECLDLNEKNLFDSIVNIHTILKNNKIIITDPIGNRDNYGRNKKGDLILIDLDDANHYGPKKKYNEKDLDYIF